MQEPSLSYTLKDISISRRSRMFVVMLRVFLKPLMRWFMRGSPTRVAKAQLQLAGRRCKNTAGLTQDYRIIGGVPGPVLGPIDDTDKTVVLWLHGGGFLIPASADVHLRLLALICKELDAVGFLPDYRLAPFNKFPAALDDAESAYRGLLDAGFAPERIVICGDSAGGHLTLSVIQRIRKAGMPMPACAVPVSPVTEMGRVHAPPSRARNKRIDAIIPIGSFGRVDDLFAGDWDASDPELSPLYADYTGFPPLYFIVGEKEVLRDDSVLAAYQARNAGVATRLDVWPVLPHAFVLFAALFAETAVARRDIVEFIQAHIPRKP